MVLKRDLYGLKTASKSFLKYVGDFLINIGFKTSRADSDIWIRKSYDYEGYDYIAIHIGDVIIADNNPYRYLHEIEMHFKVIDITDSTNYYMGNELVRVVNCIHVSSKNYVNEIMRKY